MKIIVLLGFLLLVSCSEAPPIIMDLNKPAPTPEVSAQETPDAEPTPTPAPHKKHRKVKPVVNDD